MLRASCAFVACLLLLGACADGADQWSTYRNAALGFSVDLPGTPQADDVPLASSGPTRIHRFTTTNSRRSYGVSVIPMSPGMTYDLDEGVAGALEANHGTVITDEAVTLQGYPARKVHYQGRSGDVSVPTWIMIVSTPKAVYTVLAAQFGQARKDEVERVMNSFRLLE